MFFYNATVSLSIVDTDSKKSRILSKLVRILNNEFEACQAKICRMCLHKTLEARMWIHWRLFWQQPRKKEKGTSASDRWTTYKTANLMGGVADPGSGSFLTSRSWSGASLSGSHISGPGSKPNFLRAWQEFKKIQFSVFMAAKKERQLVYFLPSSFLLFLDPRQTFRISNTAYE